MSAVKEPAIASPVAGDVVILCGGRGTRLSEETATIPKPMVRIGGMPILWHIMKMYAHFGFRRFVLALGYRAETVKEFFVAYRATGSDLTLRMDPGTHPEYHGAMDEKDWEITFADTGLNTLKGGRIKRIERYLKSDVIHLTYGDGVADVDLRALYQFHLRHGRIGTVTAVRPPSRFGEMRLNGDLVEHFEEKPQLDSGFINGGFFVFQRRLLGYLTAAEDCDFEFGPLQRLAQDGELVAYRHLGFWQCMDNVRERDYLNRLWDERRAPWRVWEPAQP